MLTAYMLGPWCAAIVGGSYNLLAHTLPQFGIDALHHHFLRVTLQTAEQHNHH